MRISFIKGKICSRGILAHFSLQDYLNSATLKGFQVSMACFRLKAKHLDLSLDYDCLIPKPSLLLFV